MITNKEVTAKRKEGKAGKEGALDEAYQMALQLMSAPHVDEWDIKAFGWCLIDLIKRDTQTGNQQNLAHYRQQLETIKVDPKDEILLNGVRNALSLFTINPIKAETMASLFDFSQAISKLNKEKMFSDALKYFKGNKSEFTPVQIGANKFIVYEVIAALIELNHYDAVFAFIEQHKVILESKSFSFLLKKVKNKTTPNWIFTNKFCDLVSVDSLSTECRTGEVVVKGEKKETEFASNKEDWYAIKTKALFETKQYEECFDLSKIALHAFEKFHYSNDTWFVRKIALCKKHLGKSEEAITELQQVLSRKKEWYIQKELAELYFEKGETEKAFKLSIDAANNFGDLDYKIDLLVLLGKLLEIKEEKDLAFKHYNLSKLLRIREDENKIKWSVPNELYNKLKSFGIQEAPLDKLSELKRELKKYWDSFKPQQQPQGNRTQSQTNNQHFTGNIFKILHNDEKGADGFLKFDANKSIYFRVSATDEIIKKIIIGLEVEFEILSATDDKKERAMQLKIK